MTIDAASASLPAAPHAGHRPANHHTTAAATSSSGQHDRAPAEGPAVTETRGNTVNTMA